MFNIVHRIIRGDDRVYEFFVQLYECWHVNICLSGPGHNLPESIGR